MDLRVFTEPQQGATYETLLRVAKAAEDLSYGAFFRSDHYLHMGSADGLPGPTDAWITLVGLARETKRIRLGTLMTVSTFRLPGVLAIQVAQVDQMSGGRVELGLGSGWYGAEHEAYGIPFPKEKFGRLEEQLAIVTGLWRTPVGERFSFNGTYYQLKDSPALPKCGAEQGAGPDRRARRQADPGARRAVRRRVQHPVRVAQRHGAAVQAGPCGGGGARAQCSAASSTPTPWSRASARPTRTSGAAPRRSAVMWTS